MRKKIKLFVLWYRLKKCQKSNYKKFRREYNSVLEKVNYKDQYVSKLHNHQYYKKKLDYFYIIMETYVQLIIYSDYSFKNFYKNKDIILSNISSALGSGAGKLEVFKKDLINDGNLDVVSKYTLIKEIKESIKQFKEGEVLWG